MFPLPGQSPGRPNALSSSQPVSGQLGPGHTAFFFFFPQTRSSGRSSPEPDWLVFNAPGCILSIRLVQLGGALCEESYSGSLLKAAGALLFRSCVVVPVGLFEPQPDRWVTLPQTPTDWPDHLGLSRGSSLRITPRPPPHTHCKPSRQEARGVSPSPPLRLPRMATTPSPVWRCRRERITAVSCRNKCDQPRPSTPGTDQKVCLPGGGRQ